jgi:hypothetical protein
MADTGRAVVSAAALVVFVVGMPAGNLATGGAPDRLLHVRVPDNAEQAWEALRWSYLDGSLVPWLALCWSGPGGHWGCC